MDNPIFPYGPSPSRLVQLAEAFVSHKVGRITLDDLERLGVPKTQVSIALSGLRQLGFLTPDGNVSELTEEFADPSSRASACAKVINEVYPQLAEVALSNAAASEPACQAYLQRWGRGDSAREKILKLFWFFWAESNGTRVAAPMTPIVLDASPSTDRVVAQQRNDERPHGDAAKVVGVQEGTADAAAVQLADSLIRYCKSREAILDERRAQLEALQDECARIEQDLSRAREMLEQHLRLYPSLTTLLP